MRTMRWYNPVTRKIEDDALVPRDDVTARRILKDRPGAVEEYNGWRITSGITEAMIFTGQSFQNIDAGREPPR